VGVKRFAVWRLVVTVRSMRLCGGGVRSHVKMDSSVPVSRSLHVGALPGHNFLCVGASVAGVILNRMKTAVSIPDRVFQSAEKLAARIGVSRSQFYAQALASLVEKHREDLTTAQLNEVYGPGGEESSLDRDASTLQMQSLQRGK
jgi:hypothetical protein